MKASLITLSFLLITFLMGFKAPIQSEQLKIVDLKVEYKTNPLGIDQKHPRLSWQLNSRQRNTRQKAYQIQVARDKQNLKKGRTIWDTGKKLSGQSIQVSYDGPTLESGERYYWRTRVWDNHGNQSEWSEVAFWEMGLLSATDWVAKWIEPGFTQDSTTSQPAPMLRNEFSVNGQIQSARAYVTSHGLYQMKINGQRVGNQEFAPGWTSYHNRLQYQTYDITNLIQKGKNAVGVTLGDGWYRGNLFKKQRNLYGSQLGLLAQIEVVYRDGSRDIFSTNGNWSSSTGPILKSDIYNGESYDARLEKDGWTRPGYNDEDWQAVHVADYGKDNLIAPEGPPVQKIEQLKPLEILVTPEGDTVVDMGQNMVGWIQLDIKGKKGTKVILTHAEVLDKEGNFYTKNLRRAAQKDTYILSGKGNETFEPHFTFHGFRYVKIENYPGTLDKKDITGIVIHSDMEPTGHFATSNSLVNQLQHNIVWGQKGNFLDVPTDCPQRDERLGWTGDIQVFSQTACYNMGAAGFLTKWLRDLNADQLNNGSVPNVIPSVGRTNGAAGWADASVIVPWTIYKAYGDKRVLKTQYESMKGWVEYLKGRAQSDATPYLWDNNDWAYGDWLSFNSASSDYPGAYTEKNLIKTAYFARSTDLLHRIAEILGKKEDARKYADLFENIKDAFQKEYVTPSGRVLSNTQTSYLLALKFNLLPDDVKEEAASYLVARVNDHGHLTTGFLGTPLLNPVLSHNDHTKEAYQLLLRKKYPSWLYPVTHGATTIWERWDGIKPNGAFQNPSMNSFNHYAYGAVGEWLYKTVAGIQIAAPGYKKIKIAPIPGGDFTYVRSIKESMYGRIESEWEISNGRFTLNVKIPANTTATIVVPDAADKKIINKKGISISQNKYVKDIDESDNNVIFRIGSGDYQFSYPIEYNQTSKDKDENLTIHSTLAELIAEKRTRNLLKQHLPKLMNSPWLSQVMGFSLERAKNVLSEKLQIPVDHLKEFNDEMQAL